MGIPPFRYAANTHISISDGFYFFQTVLGYDLIKPGEKPIQCLKQFTWLNLLDQSRKPNKIRKKIVADE